jgi:hypothetical protein
MSGMVGRFMKSFRTDDGVRGDRLADRQLHADADDVGALAEGEATAARCARPRARFEALVVFAPIDRFYSRLLGWSMQHRGIVSAVAVLVLLSTGSAVSSRQRELHTAGTIRPSSKSPSVPPRERASRPPTLLANRVASAVRQMPEVDYTMVTVAGDGGGTRNVAGVFVKLKALESRDRDVFAIVDDIRRTVLPNTAGGVRTSVAATGGMGGNRGGGAGDVQFVLQGPSLLALQTQSEKLLTRMRDIPGVVDADTNLNTGKPELSVRCRSSEGRGSRRASSPMRGSAAAAGGRRSGDDLQRTGRAVRGARACRRSGPVVGSGDRAPSHPIDPSRRRPVGRRRLALRSSAPTEIRRLNRLRTGHREREPGARRVTGRESRTRSRRAERADAGTGIPRRVLRPVARAQSHGQRDFSSRSRCR